MLISVTVIAVSLVIPILYQQAWQRHCQRLTPSLYRFVLEHRFGEELLEPLEVEFEGEIFKLDPHKKVSSDRTPTPIDFSDGWDSVKNEWNVPAPLLLEKIGLEHVHPVARGQSSGDVFYIQNVRWLDWDTVVLDCGTSNGFCSAGGSGEFQKEFQYAHGLWFAVVETTVVAP